MRQSNCDHDIEVLLADGMYRLERPLVFTAKDGGCNGHHVEWRAADGASPVISGATRVADWNLYDAKRQIYVADVPIGADARQIWVNDRLANRTQEEVPRSAVTFTQQGIILAGSAFDDLATVAAQGRLEIVATGFFTRRISPVERVDGHTLVMKEPAWQNNLWGYDTIERPFGPQFAHLYLANSLALLREPGQWYLDPEHGKLYLRPPAGADIHSLDVELPHLTVLMAIGDSLDAPVADLTFRGIRFSYTSWPGPSSSEGYASQQSGSYLMGRAVAYPTDPIADCSQGCPAFETVRNEWSQMPASIQVAAAQRITFDQDVFAHLGQYALGIGNDSDANITGAGLGTSDIRVTRSVFTDDAGGAVLAGGVRRDAHHPRDPRMINRQLLVSNNRIQDVSKDYLDNSAILETYVEGALILHNDISDVPYDAIDIGYGWGMQDPGGNPNYRVRMHGYDFKENLVYQTPTTHRDVVVAWNRIHGAKKLFHDGGAIYNLSASPGTLITENYIFNNSGRIALYLDEGSRYITVRRNVVDDPAGTWLNINTVHSAFPLRISTDNTASDNWHNGTKVGGMWTNYEDDLILDDHLVKDDQWPDDARKIMEHAGIEPSAGRVEYGEATGNAAAK
ncbi:right-handed parallel beta-helix repeat-containing protein [Edaphobacter sp.]|uniref:right-handed parallel beta-helix repeat-containing protein n=1 Tax=Edaphobacter sp. TaxID=1934404 RepID=UPI002DB9E9F5|nr:right-handed parallel beta-helix repeat-containing protein [Edaphobacter sp.]HEU5341871.1 right-handed parallel beta-helix repeat-containing protein [Edaphobacter sp.]